MIEANLYNPILRGLLSHGHIAHKIADGTYGKKPCDIIGVTKDGRGLLMEVKLSSELCEELDWTDFAPHQRTWLEAAAKRGGVALCAVYGTKEKRLRVWQLRQDKTPALLCTLARTEAMFVMAAFN